MARSYAGRLMFPVERAGRCFAAYERWTRQLGRGRDHLHPALAASPLPDLPDFLRGQSFCATSTVPSTSGRRRSTPPGAAPCTRPRHRHLRPDADRWTGCPPGPAGTHSRRRGRLPARGVRPRHHRRAAGGGRAGRAESALLAVDLRQIGGAVGRSDPRGGAIDHLPGRFLGFSVGVAPFPEAAVAVRGSVEAVRSALSPWIGGRDYGNFRESATGADRLYPASSLERLRAIRNRYNGDRGRPRQPPAGLMTRARRAATASPRVTGPGPAASGSPPGHAARVPRCTPFAKRCHFIPTRPESRQRGRNGSVGPPAGSSGPGSPPPKRRVKTRGMRLGLHIASFTYPDGPGGLREDLARIASSADDLGFAGSA